MKGRGHLNQGVKLIGVILAVVSFILAFTGFTLESQAGQYTLFSQRITIDSDAMIGNGSAPDPINFPFLLKLSDSLNPLFSYAQTDGDDIFFTDAAGVRIDHEIVKYDAVAKEFLAWVRIPVLSPIADTDIYMYYGNPNASNQENPEGVWDGNYVMVQHLDETSGQHLDSTIQHNDSTVVNVTAQGTAGKIGGADEFTTDKYVNIPDKGVNTPLDLVGNGPVTYSAWVYARSLGQYNIGCILSKIEGGAGYAFGFDGLNCAETNSYTLVGSRAGFWYGRVCSTENALTQNQWHYVVYAYETSEEPGYIYVDAVENNSRISSAANADSSTNLTIGRLWGSFDGYIDEVRISNTNRSADWIRAEFNNQNTPGNYPAFAANGTQTCTDNDNDGYYVEGGLCGPEDCDDNNASVHSYTWYKDTDNDGYSDGSSLTQCLHPDGYKLSAELIATSGDCNDSDAGVNPGASEVCDGIDNNCDGEIDEGVLNTYYRDEDIDTYGSITNTISECSMMPPAGYVTDNTDCDDTDAMINPETIWFKDIDNDGYSEDGSTLTQCLRPDGYALSAELRATSGDCNDSDELINPGFPEVHYNGKDDDCNPLTKDDDLDNDGYPVAADWNDSDPNIRPGSGAAEICDDKDNDSDGLTDEGAVTACWAKTGLSGGGMQHNITVDPLNPDIVYVTSDMIGAYRSIDKGEHWEWINRGIFRHAFSIAVDPTNNDRIYLSNNKGIFKSDDKGKTWDTTPVYSNGSLDYHDSGCVENTYNASGNIISKVVNCIYERHPMHVDPDGTVYVPTLTGEVIVGRDNGAAWESHQIVSYSYQLPISLNCPSNPDGCKLPEINAIASPEPGVIIVATERGLFKHTVITGETVNVLTTEPVRDVIMDPATHKLYALVAQQVDLSGSGSWVYADFYKSMDGGATWDANPATEDIEPVHHFEWVDAGGGVYTNRRIYTHRLIQKYIGVNNSGAILIVNREALYWSNDEGVTWNYIYYTDQMWPRGDYIFHQEDGNEKFLVSIAAGQAGTWYAATGGAAGRSDDNGNTWKWIAKGLRLNGGIKCIEDPNNTNDLDNPTSDNKIYCGLSDNGFVRSTNGGRTWTQEPYMGWDDVMDIVFDPANPDILYAMFLEGNIHILKGQKNLSSGTWEWTKLKEIESYPSIWDAPSFIRFDPDNPNKIYASFRYNNGVDNVGVLVNNDKTQNDGKNWEPMMDGLTASDNLQFMDIAPNGDLYLATTTSQWENTLYRYNRDTSQWSSIEILTPNLRLGTGFSLDPALNSNAQYTLWAGCQNTLTSQKGACKSEDGGLTWQFMTGYIGDRFISATHTTESGVVFIAFNSARDAATDLGIWYSLDGGSQWTKFIDGINDLYISGFTSFKSPVSNNQRIWVNTGTTPMYFQCTDGDHDGYAVEDGLCGPVDCNDNDKKEHPGQTWYKDADDDGYSDGTTNTTSCARPAGYKTASELTDASGIANTSGDCNDDNDAIKPSDCQAIVPVTNPADWYHDQGLSSEWQYRQAINIRGGITTSGSLPDFPVLIKITDSHKYSLVFSEAKDNGDDIVFTDSSGNKLPHEIEEYDNDAGILVAWVSIPALSATADTDIYMYFGNPNAPIQENPEGVWDSNYVMVQHLSETSPLQHFDSTIQHNDSTVVNVTAQGTAGKIGGADEFNTNQYINIPDKGFDTPLDLIDNTSGVTYSAWVYANNLGLGNSGGILSKIKDGAGYDFGLDGSNCAGTNSYTVRGSRAGLWDGPTCSTANALTPNRWYYVVYTYNAGKGDIYVDGAFNNSRTSAATNADTLTDLTIGAAVLGSWDGFIDEVRISNAARSAEWIAAEYRNQNNPESYIHPLTQEIFCTDNDHDGYAVEGGECGLVDCNDNDAAINPGALAGVSYPVTFTTSVPPNTLTVNVVAAVDCGGTCPALTYDWNWGDGELNGIGESASHTYAMGGAKTINLTARTACGIAGSYSRSLMLDNPDLPPTAIPICEFDANSWKLTVTDASTDDGPDADTGNDDVPSLQIVVDWGDGTVKSIGSAGMEVSHTYNKVGTFSPSLKARDTKLQTDTAYCDDATTEYFTITGEVKKSSGAALSSATVKLLDSSNVVKKTMLSTSIGTFSFGSLKPDAYKISVTKSGYTFPITNVPVGPDSLVNVITALTP